MFKQVARFITRMQGQDDGLFVGSVLEGSQNFFKPNTVYAIKEVMGTLTISEIGQGCGGGSGKENNCPGDRHDHPDVMFHWGQEIGNIMVIHGKQILLTVEEYRALRKHFQEEDNIDRLDD